MHPLNKLAKKVHYFGWYQKVLGRMRRLVQPLYGWAMVLLMASCAGSMAPSPFQVTNREYIYLKSKDPNSTSLINSDPDTFRTESRIDLSLKPDVIP